MHNKIIALADKIVQYFSIFFLAIFCNLVYNVPCVQQKRARL